MFFPFLSLSLIISLDNFSSFSFFLIPHFNNVFLLLFLTSHSNIFSVFSLLKNVFPCYFSDYSSKNLQLFYRNCHLISCYSPSSASSPSPSSSSLSSPPLPPSTAFPFPFHMDPHPPSPAQTRQPNLNAPGHRLVT